MKKIFKHAIILIGCGLSEDLLINELIYTGRLSDKVLIITKRSFEKVYEKQKFFDSQGLKNLENIRIMKLDLENPSLDLETISVELIKDNIIIETIIYGARLALEDFKITEIAKNIESSENQSFQVICQKNLQVGAFSLIEILICLKSKKLLSQSSQNICLNSGYANDPNPDRFILSMAKINLDGVVKMLRQENFSISQIFICGKISNQINQIPTNKIVGEIIMLMATNRSNLDSYLNSSGS